jgi:hypothetical protein
VDLWSGFGRIQKQGASNCKAPYKDMNELLALPLDNPFDHLGNKMAVLELVAVYSDGAARVTCRVALR